MIHIFSRAKSQEPRAKSQEPRAKSQEPRAKSQEPRAKSQEPRAKSQEPRAKSRGPELTGSSELPPPVLGGIWAKPALRFVAFLFAFLPAVAGAQTNRPPTIEIDAGNVERIPRGTSRNFGVTVSDPDGDTLTVRVRANRDCPATISSDNTTLAVSVRATAGERICRIHATASDGTDSDSDALSVRPAAGVVHVNPEALSTPEGGTASYNLWLTGSPVGTVTVTATSGDTGIATVSPDTLTFTSNNYSAQQTVTVTGVDNSTDEADRAVRISHTVAEDCSNAPVRCNYLSYTGASVSSVNLTITDNDDSPGSDNDDSPGSDNDDSPGSDNDDSPGSKPGAVTNLTAVVEDGAVVLTWEAPSSDGGAAITHYEYRINGALPWISTRSTETTHTVTGLNNGTTYIFEVRAVTSSGTGIASGQTEATPEVFTLNFAHFANGGGFASNLVFVNPGSVPVRPAIYFYDTGGEPIAAASVVDVTGDLEVREDGGLTVLTEVPPLGELTVPTHGRGELLTGSVKVVSGVPLGGGLRFDLHQVGMAMTKVGPRLRNAIFPARRTNGGINTGVAIHNLEAEPLEVRCRLMRGGAVLEQVSLPLTAHGQTSWTIDAAFPMSDTADFTGSVRCDAARSGWFTALAVEMDHGAGIFTTLPVFPVNRRGGSRAAVLDFAHFVNGDGATSDLVFVNVGIHPSRPPLIPFHPSIPPMRPVLYFYDTEGALVPPASVVDVTGDLEVREDGGLTVRTEMLPLAELTISTHGRGALLTGSVQVASDNPLGGMLRYDLPHFGEAVAEAGSPVSDAIFPVRRQEEGVNTGVALHNLESSAELVRCELLRKGVLLDSTMISLEANSQTSWTIDQAFPGADTSDFAGSVRCDAMAGGSFSAVALEMDPGARVFTALPVVPLAESMDQE